VDPELPLDWARITRSPPLSVIVNDEPVDVPNPMPATMRQIAYEVDVTLTTGLTQFLE
jgi:hypothetical protein